MRDVASNAVDLVQRLELRQLNQPDEMERARALHAVFVKYHLSGPDPARLVRQVTQLLETDETFRRSVTAQLPALNGNTISAGGSINARGGVIAGGNVSRSNNKKISFGGILVAAVAVVALFFAGRQVIIGMDPDGTGGGSTLDGSSTCRDFLSADQATQVTGLKRVYTDANRPDLLSDPFILQNGLYHCGRAPDMKLEGLARR